MWKKHGREKAPGMLSFFWKKSMEMRYTHTFVYFKTSGGTQYLSGHQWGRREWNRRHGEKQDFCEYTLFCRFNFRIKLKKQALKMKREIIQINHNCVTEPPVGNITTQEGIIRVTWTQWFDYPSLVGYALMTRRTSKISRAVSCNQIVSCGGSYCYSKTVVRVLVVG